MIKTSRSRVSFRIARNFDNTTLAVPPFDDTVSNMSPHAHRHDARVSRCIPHVHGGGFYRARSHIRYRVRPMFRQ
jgi:hypothetical protein